MEKYIDADLREKIVREVEQWKEKTANHYTIEAEARWSEANYILGILDSLQQEPPEYESYKVEREMWVEATITNSFPKQDGDFISEEDYRKILRMTADNFYEMGRKQKPELYDMGRWDEESYNNGIHHVLQNPEVYGLTKKKPAEWSEEDVLNRTYEEGFNDGLKYRKPVHRSDEDKKMAHWLICLVNANKELSFSDKVNLTRWLEHLTVEKELLKNDKRIKTQLRLVIKTKIFVLLKFQHLLE